MARVAGAFLSALGHAGIVCLAAIGPPFLWAPPDLPVPATVVTLLSPAELASLKPPPPAPASPQPSPAPSPSPPRAAVPMPAPLVPAPDDAPPPAATTLAPGFDATAPLGVGEAAPADTPDEGFAGIAPEFPPELAPAAEPEAGPDVDLEEVRAGYAAQVQRAVSRARVYPQVARARGLEGRVVFQLVLAGDGRLLASQLLQSSGAMTLDRAALTTVRRASYPPAPAAIAAERMPVAVEVVFTGSDR